MKQLIEGFTNQLKEALIIGQNYRFKSAKKEFSNVILTGLGGSGIGGSIVQNFVFDKMKLPFIVNKDYFLPAFVSRDSLVIVSSYSGNTEETIAALKKALQVKATIVCITSGGEISKIATRKKVDCILLPAGMPPRACIGYSMVQVLYTLANFGLIKGDFEKNIAASIRLLNAESSDIKKKARSIAQKLNGKTPVIYSSSEYEGLAIRIRQQINENAKMLAWHGAIPEMNHNELVGWKDKAPGKAVLLLRNENDYERVQTRMEINKKVIKKCTPNIIEVYSKGKSYWERIFYFIHLTDWVSVYLADLHKVDATEVKVIDYLKGELAKV
ncbi:MAG TPA: bifunctional phosphoglucose/phosphomannose isomerase [Flavipsychrobacter sp.]|nr:bifunctional phosphoglucose/phosphomannose isomerase [Flavipsychrobacter sp.]